MKNRAFSVWGTLAVFFFSCTVGLWSGPPQDQDSVQRPKSREILDAQKFPEIKINLSASPPIDCKIIRIEDGERIVCLPAPYWGTQTVSLPLKNVETIMMLDPPSGKLLRSVLIGGAIFGLTGGYSILKTARYREDYKAGIGNMFMYFGVGVLWGLVLGGRASLPSGTAVNFRYLPPEEQIKFLKDLMGI